MLDSSKERWTLIDLPLSARLALAAFLISVGLGYLSALVQVHFQDAKPGEPLPSGEDAVLKFHGQIGELPMSKIEQLLSAPEDAKFNGTGQMRTAFTRNSEEWKATIKERAASSVSRGGPRRAPRTKPTTKQLEAAEADLRAERETELLAVLDWIKKGANKNDWQQDRFCLPDELQKKPLAKEFYHDPKEEQKCIKIQTVWMARCASCHKKVDARDVQAANYPLETIEQIKQYAIVKPSSAIEMKKLAQTTHVHLLAFSMLYGLTGLILAFTGYPGFIRAIIAPLPLIAQMVDISFWWLARLDEPYGPMLARLIPITGGVVAVGLLLQIVLSLFDMFRWIGKSVLVLLLVAALGGGYVVGEKFIKPHLEKEKAPKTAAEE